MSKENKQLTINELIKNCENWKQDQSDLTLEVGGRFYYGKAHICTRKVLVLELHNTNRYKAFKLNDINFISTIGAIDFYGIQKG